MRDWRQACFLIAIFCYLSSVTSQSCQAEVFDHYSSGWRATEIITVTPPCPGCTYSRDNKPCACANKEVPAGPGQPGTASGGPCEAINANYPTDACFGFSRANWTLQDNFIPTSITDLSTNKQTLIGLTNMSPPGIYDTRLSSTGFYAIKISTTGSDDDWMGFVFGYEPMTLAGTAANRIEFTWRAKCCCDYEYPGGAPSCPIPGDGERPPGCCSGGTGDDPSAQVFLVNGSLGEDGYSRILLGTATEGGWRRNVEYNFHVELTPRLLRIYRSIPDNNVAPVLIFNYARPPSNPFDLSGNFAYYTFSQPQVNLGPLEIAGEMGFGTESCTTHPAFAEVSIATNCNSASQIEAEISWDDGAFQTINLPASNFQTTGARFEEIIATNPSLNAGNHKARIRVRPVGGMYTEKTIDPVIVYDPIVLVVAPVSSSNFPVGTGTCGISRNTFYLPWCNLDVGSFRASPSGGNGLGDENNYGYTWNVDGNSIFDVNPLTNLGVSSVSITVDDAYECTATSPTYNLERIESPSLTHEATCGASINIIPTACYDSPSFVYSWDTGATTPSITDLQPGTYNVQVGDSSLGCTASLALSAYSVTIPNFSFRDIHDNNFQQTGFACSGSPSVIQIHFEDWLACATSEFSGTLDFGDGTTPAVLTAADFTFLSSSRLGFVNVEHNYPYADTYSASLSITSSKYTPAGTTFDLVFDVVVETLAELTFPPTLPSPGYPMLVYIPYVWEWSGGNLRPGDVATAVLFEDPSTPIVLSNDISLDDREWTYRLHALIPGEYVVEIRRNADGCLIGDPKNIEMTLHHET